jgi:hypothetical protein
VEIRIVDSVLITMTVSLNVGAVATRPSAHFAPRVCLIIVVKGNIANAASASFVLLGVKMNIWITANTAISSFVGSCQYDGDFLDYCQGCGDRFCEKNVDMICCLIAHTLGLDIVKCAMLVSWNSVNAVRTVPVGSAKLLIWCTSTKVAKGYKLKVYYVATVKKVKTTDCGI